MRILNIRPDMLQENWRANEKNDQKSLRVWKENKRKAKGSKRIESQTYKGNLSTDCADNLQMYRTKKVSS